MGKFLNIAGSVSVGVAVVEGDEQKFSHKGWICKTYEGEMAMTTVPGVAPILWVFSVRDEKVASQLTQAMGKRLVLHYKEYRYLPTTCFGETAYFVDHVEVTE